MSLMMLKDEIKRELDNNPKYREMLFIHFMEFGQERNLGPISFMSRRNKHSILRAKIICRLRSLGMHITRLI